MSARIPNDIERAATNLLARLDETRTTTGATYQAVEALRTAIEALRTAIEAQHDERCGECSERHEGDCDPADISRMKNEMVRIMGERDRKLGRR